MVEIACMDALSIPAPQNNAQRKQEGGNGLKCIKVATATKNNRAQNVHSVNKKGERAQVYQSSYSYEE